MAGAGVSRLKLKKLESALDNLEPFDRPKLCLEQYATSGHLGACLLHLAQTTYGDVEGRCVGDLGCGSGRLALGAALLGAAHVVGYDIDPDAVQVFAANKHQLQVDNCDAVLCDVTSFFGATGGRWRDCFDTIVMNPPFGTRANSRGVDVQFVEAALSLAPVVYSLHKTSTRSHLMRKFSPAGARVLAQLNFDLPPTYKFHTKRSVDIQVDLIRFVRQ